MKFLFYIARKGLFAQLPTPPYSDETYLWRAVLDQVLHDTGSRNRKVRLAAMKWFNLSNDDFILVCELALLEPGWVYDTYKNTLRRLVINNKELDL
jgi:hypothetical protein